MDDLVVETERVSEWSGLTMYSYFDGGSLKRKTDARGVYVEIPSLDALKRPSGKNYVLGVNAPVFPKLAASATDRNLPKSAGAYAGSVGYTAGGALSSLVGGGGAFTEARGYNVRGQMTSVSAGGFSLGLDYGTSANNRNLLMQTITVGSSVYTQHYRYDAANRLGLFVESPTAPGSVSTPCSGYSGSAKCQKYGFDAFGNLWQAEKLNAVDMLALGMALIAGRITGWLVWFMLMPGISSSMLEG